MRSTNGKKPARDNPPLKRATEAEKDERIIQTMRLVIMGYSTADIKQWFRSTLDIQWCQALRYLRLARERLREENGLTEEFTLQDMKVQHYAMAMKVAHQESGEDAKDRLAALKHAGAIYGVAAPVKIAPTDPTEEFAFNPRAAVQDLSIEELRVLRTVRDRMRELSAGGSNGN